MQYFDPEILFQSHSLCAFRSSANFKTLEFLVVPRKGLTSTMYAAAVAVESEGGRSYRTHMCTLSKPHGRSLDMSGYSDLLAVASGSG